MAQIFKHRRSFTVAVGGTDADIVNLPKGRGYIGGVVANLPAYTNDVTGTVTITDEDGDVLYSKASLAKGVSTSDVDKSIPFRGILSVKFTLSGVPGGESPLTAYVSVFVEE